MDARQIYVTDVSHIVKKVEDLRILGSNRDAIIRELSGRFYRGIQSYTTEDVKLALDLNTQSK